MYNIQSGSLQLTDRETKLRFCILLIQVSIISFSTELNVQDANFR